MSLIVGRCNGELNLRQGVESAFPRAGTDFSYVIPVFLRLDILGPEWPGLALAGTGGIDRAASGLVPEDTVAAGLFDQAVAVANLAHEPGGELFDCLTAISREPLDLIGIDPDIARCTRATCSAPGAGEGQAVAVPR